MVEPTLNYGQQPLQKIPKNDKHIKGNNKPSGKSLGYKKIDFIIK